MDRTELKKTFVERGIRKVKVGGFDVDGLLRGKLMSVDKFWSVADKGFGFCDVVFGWDMGDQLYDNAKVTGWHSGYPDTLAKIDLATFRVLRYEPDTACFLVDFHDAASHRPHAACPRGLLKRIVARAAARGFRPMVGAEFEFWLFKETPESMAQKRWHGMTPLTPGMFGYSWVREGQQAELVHDVIDTMEGFGIPIEGFHTETGPGVWEAAIQYTDAVEAADRAALFKTTMKQLAKRHGLAVTFMAKWNPSLPGSSGHLHQSLVDATGEQNLFHDPKAPNGLSQHALRYVGGQATLASELTALYSPFVNTYKRYVPGVWAPLTPSWGIENRTCAIRVIPAGAGTRVEYRQTAADINPYVAMATSIGAGLWGIENAIDPPPETKGDATAGGRPLPLTLEHAVSALAESVAAREILGEDFVDHYLASREWEVRQFRAAVTDWELARYFEAV